MKPKFTKIAAVLMIFVVLFSTMSFTIDMQNCSGYFVNTPLFPNSDNCKISDNSDCCEILDNCCNDHQIVIEGQTEMLFNTVVSSTIKKQFFVVNSLKVFFDNVEIQCERSIYKKEYSPPTLVTKKQVIHQVFLI